MFYNRKNRTLNTDRIYAGDLVFGAILARWAFHLIVAVVFVLMFVAVSTLTVFGVDPETALCGFLIGFPLLMGVLAYRWSKRCHARDAARAGAARLEAAKPVLMSEVIPGWVENPPAPWFSEDGKPLWVRHGAGGWVPAYVAEAGIAATATATPVSTVTTIGLSAHREDRI